MQRLWKLGGTVVAISIGGGVVMGCGSSVQWEPAKIPPETMVPPPNVPGEGDKSDLADAFDDIEPIDTTPEPAPAPEESGPEAPAPEAAKPEAKPAPPAPK